MLYCVSAFCCLFLSGLAYVIVAVTVCARVCIRVCFPLSFTSHLVRNSVKLLSMVHCAATVVPVFGVSAWSQLQQRCQHSVTSLGLPLG